jgi:hypothetical protein
LNVDDEESEAEEAAVRERKRTFGDHPACDRARASLKQLLASKKAADRRRLDAVTRARATAVYQLLNIWRTQNLSWVKSSTIVAYSLGRHAYYAELLRRWARAFILSPTLASLPTHAYGAFNRSLLFTQDDLVAELHLVLQAKGKFASAQALVDHSATADFQLKYNTRKPISVRTAQRWMKTMDFRWRKAPRGQFKDGHGRADVIAFRQEKYLPRLAEFSKRMQQFDRDGNVVWQPYEALAAGLRLIIHYTQDESIFYQNDQRIIRWCHKDEDCEPQPKGDGLSIMISDFVSPSVGWLSDSTGDYQARLVFRPGANRDGYCRHEDIIANAMNALDVHEKLSGTGPASPQALLQYHSAPNH